MSRSESRLDDVDSYLVTCTGGGDEVVLASVVRGGKEPEIGLTLEDRRDYRWCGHTKEAGEQAKWAKVGGGWRWLSGY
jgi:hypothetical protein